MSALTDEGSGVLYEELRCDDYYSKYDEMIGFLELS